MSLLEKIYEARKILNGTNKTNSKKLNYAYYSAESIISAAKHAFNEVGLVMIPAKMEIIGDDQIQTKNDSIMRQVTVLVSYSIYDIADNVDYINLQSLGRAQDMAEKNLSKAQTLAFKSALMQLLMIAEEGPSGETGEITSIEIENLIKDVKTDKDKSEIIKLINSLTDNKEKAKLMSKLKDLGNKNG